MAPLEGGARRARWVPPARPEWVAQANAEGDLFDLATVVPLNAESLIASATAKTGLSDFGDDAWREPFGRLVKELDEESPLNLFGRLQTRQDILHMLEGRLRIEATYAAHPEIEDEQIVAPLFIVGQGRSGTSLMLSLLASDPTNGTVKTWEAMFPCPPPEAATYLTDPRIEKADRLQTMWTRIVPELIAQHEFTGRIPTENIQIHNFSFVSPAWINGFVGQTPKYFMHCLTERDPAESYRYEKRVLKLLQWRNPNTRWIQKSPFILTHMPSVLEVYPDAGFIWPHRDPVKALASVVSLVGNAHYMRSDHPFAGDSMTQYTNPDLAAAMMARPIEWLEGGQLPRDRLCNVQYPMLIEDPIGTVTGIYAFFGIDLTEAGRVAMEQYMELNPRSTRPAHEYATGLADEIVLERAAFKPYQEYFGVQSEL